MKLFLDTGVLVAAVSTRDAHHAAARAIFERIADGEWKSVHTSDFVVAEALNFVRFKIGRREAADALLDPLFGHGGAPPIVTSILRVHAGRFATALDRYRKKFDSGLSFTDWTSIVSMEDEGLDQLATFDAAFKGLVTVVR